MPGHDERDDDPGGGVVVAMVREVRGDVERLEGRVEDNTERIHRRLDDHQEHIGDLRESNARIDGEVRHLVRAYERAATVATSQVMTDLEVRKADALAEIKDRGLDRKHRRAVRRELIFKAITIAMGLWALLQTMFTSRC